MITQEAIDKKIRISQEEIALAEKYIDELEKRKQELQEFIDSLNTVEVKQEGRQEKGEIYWYIGDVGQIRSTTECDMLSDNYRYESGNYYLTPEDAERAEKQIRLYRLLDRFSRQNGWTDEAWKYNKNASIIYFDYACNQIRIGDRYCPAKSPGVYFASEVVAQQAIDKYRDLIMEVMQI